MKLINKSGRALGVPGARASIIIGRGQSVEITAADRDAIHSNKTARAWLDCGMIEIKGSVKPESSDTAIVKHVGRGRYNAFVNGEPLSDDPLDKEQAETMAGEYNAVSP